MEFCSKKAVDLWNKHCKDKKVKVGSDLIDHLSIHDVLKVIDIALEEGQKTPEDIAQHRNLFAINFAFQKTMHWGGNTWKLTENDLVEIRDLIEPDDIEKTGTRIWGWFRNRAGKGFLTFRSMEDLGSEFMQNLSRYYTAQLSI
jgi:hypothetical protein